MLFWQANFSLFYCSTFLDLLDSNESGPRRDADSYHLIMITEKQKS